MVKSISLLLIIVFEWSSGFSQIDSIFFTKSIAPRFINTSKKVLMLDDWLENNGISTILKPNDNSEIGFSRMDGENPLFNGFSFGGAVGMQTLICHRVHLSKNERKVQIDGNVRSRNFYLVYSFGNKNGTKPTQGFSRISEPTFGEGWFKTQTKVEKFGSIGLPDLGGLTAVYNMDIKGYKTLGTTTLLAADVYNKTVDYSSTEITKKIRKI